MMNKVIVIGGGAAGMMAAVTAAENGASVILLEKNEKLGKKIYITGKGRCNVTNATNKEGILQKTVKNPRFLYSAFSALSSENLMQKLENWGCKLKIERGQRVYPISDKASDVTRAFEKRLKVLNVLVYYNTRVKKLVSNENGIVGLVTDKGENIVADAIIVATGGMSYPSTGSTGDGYNLLSDLKHNILKPTPTLIPLISNSDYIKQLQGLSLKNVRLTVQKNNKTVYTDLGEMLFTHFGISGPLVLSASAYTCQLPFKELAFTIDLKTGLTREQLEQRILRDCNENGKKQLQNYLCSLLPSRMAKLFPEMFNIQENKELSKLTKEERNIIIKNIKAFPVQIVGMRALSEAVVTRGGADVKQINPKTMESKLCKGLYVAGELLDVDALTGGFNLQIAFSTGYVAGKEAAEQNKGMTN